MLNIVRFALLSILVVTLSWAQETRGSLVGRATDPSGAAIPGVGMQAVNVETGVVNKTTTNQVGNYQFGRLQQRRLADNLDALPTSPTCSSRFNSIRSLIRTWIPSRAKVLNPGSSATTRYVPGNR